MNIPKKCDHIPRRKSADAAIRMLRKFLLKGLAAVATEMFAPGLCISQIKPAWVAIEPSDLLLPARSVISVLPK